MFDLLKGAITDGSWTQAGIAVAVLGAIGLLMFVIVQRRRKDEVAGLEGSVAALTAKVAAMTVERDNLLRKGADIESALPEAPAKEPHWSGGEIATILAAVTTLITGVGALYLGSQKQALITAEGKVASITEELERLKATHKTITDAAKPFSLDDWMKVMAVPISSYSAKGGVLTIDGTHRSGCPKQSITYTGADPAILDLPVPGRCALILVARRPTRLAFQAVAAR